MDSLDPVHRTLRRLTRSLSVKSSRSKWSFITPSAPTRANLTLEALSSALKVDKEVKTQPQRKAQNTSRALSCEVASPQQVRKRSTSLNPPSRMERDPVLEGTLNQDRQLEARKRMVEMVVIPWMTPTTAWASARWTQTWATVWWSQQPGASETVDIELEVWE